MKNKQLKRIVSVILFLFICLIAGSAFTFSTVSGQSGTTLQMAPVNPAFVEYMEKAKTQRLLKFTPDGRALGYIPPPVDLSHLSQDYVRSALKAPLLGQPPATYDLRTTGKLTAVRDQGECGSCWAFATTASLESYLLPGEERNFSENHLKNTSGFDLGHCDGGNYEMSTAYLARWSGPVDEADDPYNPASDVSPAGLTAQKHIQGVFFLPIRQHGTDNETIKQAIMTYGAIATSMYWTNSSYNSSTSSYYYSGNEAANHGVAIVGWDDNYVATNFSTTPSENGAFIIKNSWGTVFGENGYFYISYYDSILGRKSNALFNNAEEADNFTRIYQYDPLGWVTNIGYLQSESAWFANIFSAPANEKIAAVSFYTTSVNASYSIYIYTNAAAGPSSGTLAAGPVSGSFDYAGYHTVELPAPVDIVSGQKFSVVVQMTTPGYYYPVAVELPLAGYASPTANAQESYISTNGTNWQDVTNSFPNTNVCLKAFAVETPVADLAVEMTDSPDPAHVGSSLTYTITATNNGPDTAYSVEVTNTLPAGVSYSSATPSQGSCSGTSTVVCNLATINNGAAATVTLVVIPTQTGTINNTVTVNAATIDPNPINNSATTDTQVENPVPSISSLSPSSRTRGGASFTLTVNGTNFTPESRVRWNTENRDTEFVSYIQLRAQIPETDINETGTALVTVFNPTPGGGLSGEIQFSITNPAGGGGGGGGCFIATAAFGSPMESHVRILRDFRDAKLLNSAAGKAFVNFYYKNSPPVADIIAQSELLKLVTRAFLMPAVGFAYLSMYWGMSGALLIILSAMGMLVAVVGVSRRNFVFARRRQRP